MVISAGVYKRDINMKTNKLYQSVMGLVVGDALGVPYEFAERMDLDSNPVTDMTGFGAYNQPAGTWSDDSSLMLATLESFKRLDKIDCTDIMENFLKWRYDGKFTPHGTAFGIGRATDTAINNYKNGMPVTECGCRGEHDNGNGSLMRILPLAFIEHTDEDIKNVSALTHAHEISIKTCEIYLSVAENLLNGCDIEAAISKAISEVEITTIFKRLYGIKNIPRSEIHSKGYVVDTIEASMYCLLNTDNYRDCVLMAVNLGNDTDTTSAVAGGLAGIFYGIGGKKGIPCSWIEKIIRKEWIENLCR